MIFCAGCNNAPAKKDTAAKPVVNSKLSQRGTDKLMVALADYYSLKNALVASDAGKVSETSKELKKQLFDMINGLQVDTADKLLMQPYLDTIYAHTRTLAAIFDDPTCERQRIIFSSISAGMYTMLKSAGLKNGGVYKQYCPMAFNDKGAYWLSEEEEIKNPYFGKKMLECGEVQDSL